MLNKNHPLIAYQRYREAVAAGHFRITKEDTDMNFSDLLKNVLSQIRSEDLLNKFTY